MPSPSYAHSTPLRHAIYSRCNESVADMLSFVSCSLMSVKMSSYLFPCLPFESSLFLERQNRPVLIEAKNSVLYVSVGTPGADVASGATGYLLRVNRPDGGRFCFW